MPVGTPIPAPSVSPVDLDGNEAPGIHYILSGEVARNVGYASRGTFVRAFREVFGTSPLEYRSSAEHA